MGKPVILITHRVQLGEALAKRLGVPFLSSLGPEGQIQGFGLCVDSMHPHSRAKFHGEPWRDAIVIIDEVEQVIDHLLNADTEVKKHRPEILIEFSRLLAGVLNPDSEGQLITLDADLGHTSIDFVRTISGCPECRPYLVLNQYRNPSHPLAIAYENDTPDQLIEKAIQVLEGGGKVYFCTSGQKAGSAFGTVNLELRFRRRFPERRVLRVDSVTISDPSHPAFKGAGKINHLVQNYDIVIVSPTLGTGVSIDVKGHFSAVFGIFSGITPANSARQALARVREDLPIHVWAAEKAPSIFRVGNGSKSAQGLIRGQAKEAELNLRRWEEFTLVQDEGNAIVNGAPLETWAKMGAARNLELACYREYIKYGLKAGGYVIERYTEDSDENLRGLTKSIKVESQVTFCQRVAESRPFNSEADYQKSKERETKTEAERQRELRHEIQKKLLVEPTPAIVAKTQEPGWIRQIETLYYLTKGRQFLKGRDEARGQAVVQYGCAFIPDLNRSQMSNRVEALEILGVKSLLNRVLGGEEIGKDDPLIIAIHERVIANHQDLQLIGVNAPTKYPIACVNALLTLVGLKLDKMGRNKYRLRFEAAVIDAKTGQAKQQKLALHDGRLEIFEQWFKRDAGHSVKETKGQPTKQSKYSINKRSSVLEGLKEAAQISRIYIKANLCRKICALAETVWPISDQPSKVEAATNGSPPLTSHSSAPPPSPQVGATRVRLTETIRDPSTTYSAGTWGKILAIRDGLVEVLLDGFQCPIKIFPDDFETFPAA
nr:plasmid replication protein, CyRepA1 family [Acaryochloris sp. IP29b_bin.137]